VLVLYHHHGHGQQPATRSGIPTTTRWQILRRVAATLFAIADPNY
jgi:hypothetical protein